MNTPEHVPVLAEPPVRNLPLTASVLWTEAEWADMFRRALHEKDVKGAVGVLALMSCHYPERAEQLRLAVLAGLVAGK